MGEAGNEFLIQQLPYTGPVVLACLVSAGMTCLYMSRARTAGILALFGVGLMFASVVSSVLFQASLMESIRLGGEEARAASQRMQLAGFVARCVNALGIVLLSAAVFVGRPKR